MKIAVTGATGHLGRLVVQELLKSVPAQDIVAIVRNAAKAADLAAQGVQVRVAPYDDPAALQAALAGVERLLLISSSEVGQPRPAAPERDRRGQGGGRAVHRLHERTHGCDHEPDPGAGPQGDRGTPLYLGDRLRDPAQQLVHGELPAAAEHGAADRESGGRRRRGAGRQRLTCRLCGRGRRRAAGRRPCGPDLRAGRRLRLDLRRTGRRHRRGHRPARHLRGRSTPPRWSRSCRAWASTRARPASSPRSTPTSPPASSPRSRTTSRA